MEVSEEDICNAAKHGDGKSGEGNCNEENKGASEKAGKSKEKGKNTELQPENIDIKIKAEVPSAEDVEPEKGECGETEKCDISGKHDERDVSEKHDKKKEDESSDEIVLICHKK